MGYWRLRDYRIEQYLAPSVERSLLNGLSVSLNRREVANSARLLFEEKDLPSDCGIPLGCKLKLF